MNTVQKVSTTVRLSQLPGVNLSTTAVTSKETKNMVNLPTGIKIYSQTIPPSTAPRKNRIPPISPLPVRSFSQNTARETSGSPQPITTQERHAESAGNKANARRTESGYSRMPGSISFFISLRRNEIRRKKKALNISPRVAMVSPIPVVSPKKAGMEKRK